MPRWSTADEEKLEFLYKAGKTVEDLTEIFGRKEKTIIEKLKGMGLYEEPAPEPIEFTDEEVRRVNDILGTGEPEENNGLLPVVHDPDIVINELPEKEFSRK